ncbi:helix-turn-helix domain-containing protein [Streptomyces aureus]|uniref:helix-turn-helix domain-containing protein n=1 Tax=Streptomyces aureus TaxID=193461 RepID=UPI00340078FF
MSDTARAGESGEGGRGAAEATTDEVLAEVGPRLRRIRKERGATLAGLSEATGISVSTLSRLESRLRKPSLELLLPIARAHQVALDELVGAPPVGDPRVRAEPIVRHGRTHWPLTRQPGGLQAYKVLEPKRTAEPDPRTHEGYEWLYVLSGRLRVVLGEHDVVLEAGEAAEFDTRVPHWFGSTGEGPAEFLSLFGPQGERMHVRARPKARSKEG